MRILILYTLVVAILSGCSNIGSRGLSSSLDGPKPEIIFSVNHGTFSEDNQPEEFRISSDTLYTITKWRGWEGKLIEYKTNIYDGEDELAFSMSGRLLPDRRVYYYQSNYGPHNVIDEPGIWRVEIYVNNVLVSAKKIAAVE